MMSMDTVSEVKSAKQQGSSLGCLKRWAHNPLVAAVVLFTLAAGEVLLWSLYVDQAIRGRPTNLLLAGVAAVGLAMITILVRGWVHAPGSFKSHVGILLGIVTYLAAFACWNKFLHGAVQEKRMNVTTLYDIAIFIAPILGIVLATYLVFMAHKEQRKA